MLILLVLVAQGCRKTRIGFDTYDLNYQQSVTIDKNKQVRFSQILEDSRCPVDTQCVWAGRAVIGFDYIDGGDLWLPFSLALDPENPELADTILLERYRVELLEVLPVRVTTETPDSTDYKVRILVERT